MLWNLTSVLTSKTRKFEAKIKYVLPDLFVAIEKRDFEQDLRLNPTLTIPLRGRRRPAAEGRGRVQRLPSRGRLWAVGHGPWPALTVGGLRGPVSHPGGAAAGPAL